MPNPSSLSSVMITDGLDQVDITVAQIEKSGTIRSVVLKPANRPGDIVETFGDEGIILSITGTWVTGAGQADYRSKVQYWHDNNVAVFYNDGYTFGWFSIYKFHYRFNPGVPPSTLIDYKLELHESIRRSVDDSGGLPTNTITTATFLSTNTPSTFSDQGRVWVTYDTGSPLYWVANLTSINQTLLGKITLSVSSTGADWNRVTDIVGSNATNGLSVWSNPSTSLWEASWCENQVLKYVRGTINSATISLSAVNTISSVGGMGETNLHPYLYVSSAGTDFVTVTSTGGTFMTYDSVDGISWIGRRPYTKPMVSGNVSGNFAPSVAGDLNRYTSFYIAHISSVATIPPLGGYPFFKTSTRYNPVANSSSQNLAFPAQTVSAGDAVVVWLAQMNPAQGNNTNVIDNEGNTYTNQTVAGFSLESSFQLWLWTAKATSASSNFIITAQWAASTTSTGGIAELYGSVNGFGNVAVTDGTSASSYNLANTPASTSLITAASLVRSFPLTFTEGSLQTTRDQTTADGSNMKLWASDAGSKTTVSESWTGSFDFAAASLELTANANTLTGNPELFMKRIVFHSQSAGVFGTTVLGGYSERDYSIDGRTTSIVSAHFNDEFFGNIVVFGIGDWASMPAGNTIWQTPTQTAPIYDSSIVCINDPYKSLSSVGVGAFIDSKGGLYYLQLSDFWDSTLTSPNNPALSFRSDTAVASANPTFGHLIRMTSGGAQFITAGLTSSNGNLDLFYVENNVVRRYTFGPPTGTNPSELDTTNTPLGTSFNLPTYTNTPRYTLGSAGERFVIWTEAS